jgi:hypothetical protein
MMVSHSLTHSLSLATFLHHLSVAVSICPKRCSTYRAGWHICACVCKRRAVSGYPDTQTHTDLPERERKRQRAYAKMYMSIHTYTANTDHI